MYNNSNPFGIIFAGIIYFGSAILATSLAFIYLPYSPDPLFETSLYYIGQTSSPNYGNTYTCNQTFTYANPCLVDLELTSDVDNATPYVGDTVNFNIMVINNGAGNATGIAIQDALPRCVSYVSNSPSQGSYNGISGIWMVGTLNVLQYETLCITAKVTTSGTYNNTAQVNTSDQPDVDSVPDNDLPAEDDQDNAVLNVQ